MRFPEALVKGELPLMVMKKRPLLILMSKVRRWVATPPPQA